MAEGSIREERLGTAPVTAPLLPAVLAGLGAALVGGIAWTVIMAMTGYEIGFAAWALGGFVGFAMQQATTRRDKPAAMSAAGLALVGLLIARVLIGEFVLGSVSVGEVLADDELMAQAGALDLQFSNALPPEVQAGYDALGELDTIPDALWADMLAAGEAHLNTLSPEDRELVAQQFTQVAFAQVGLVGRVTAQMSAYDVLWALLAVSTAWGMMKKKEEEAPTAQAPPA